MAASNVTPSAYGQLTSPSEAFFGLRTMFYACTPNESSFEKIEDVPRYVDKASPFFFALILIEAIVLQLQGRKDHLPRWNDSFSSLAAGIVSQLPLLLVRNIEMASYIYIHENWRLCSLPWNSAWTWWLCMLGTDLGYYWVHRCAHEINFMWAGHQTHHSSEDYNLTTALRQGVFQRYSSWIFYLPMALFIPAPMFIVHIQFNLLYQFWIHTETITTLGPLEYILNTPSHHRVHHGVNRYCIDKNYAGVLIIWDRMFGTFEPERKTDEVVYGLTHQLNSWNPIYTQTHQWSNIFSAVRNAEGFSNKLWCLLKGPGWSPGKPRLGLIEDIPDAHAPAKKFNKTVHGLLNVYCLTHFVLTLALYETAVKYQKVLSVSELLLTVLFVLWTLTDIGLIYENRSSAKWMEVIRSVVFMAVDRFYISSTYTNLPFIYEAIKVVITFSLMFSVGKIMTGDSSSKKVN